jgi:hypothetical protein
MQICPAHTGGRTQIRANGRHNETTTHNKEKQFDGYVEKKYIFKETKANKQINDKLTVQFNPIFDAIV